MEVTMIEKIIAKYKETREEIKAVKERHTEELRQFEEFQAKRETALIENAGIEAFGFITDLYINGRDGKSEKKKEEENIALNQEKLEAWLLKILASFAEGVKTEFGTVFKSRKESVTCADFEMYVKENMVKHAVKDLFKSGLMDNEEEMVDFLMENLHLEMLTKNIRKESCLELMGEQAKDGSRPKSPPAGANYSSKLTVGVRKPTGR